MDKPDCKFYEFGEFRLDVKERVLLKGDEEILLTGKVFDLLLYLIQNEGRTLEHNEILEAVWPDSFVEQANLKKGISTLRKLFGEAPEESRYIKTVPRRGYRFVAAVKPVLENNDEVFVVARRQYQEIIEEEIIEEDLPEEPKLIETKPHAFLPAANAQTIDVVTERKKSNQKVYLLAAVAGVVILLLASWLAYRFLFANRTPPPSIENLTLSKLSNTGNVLFALVTPDGQSVVYGTTDEKGDRALYMRRVGSKASVIQLMPPSPVFFWGWSISPDGNYVYYVTARRDANFGTLYRVSLLGGKTQLILESANACGGFSPDGKRILIVRWGEKPNQVELISINAENGGDEKVIAATSYTPNFLSPHWSPDGRKIFYARNDGEISELLWSIVEIPAEGGKERVILPARKARIWSVIWLKDSGGFLMNANDMETNLAQLYYVSADGVEHRLTNDLSFYFSLSMSSDGKTFASAQRQFEVDVWLISDGKADEARKLTVEPNSEGNVSWTPDGRIVYAFSENNRFHIWIMNEDGTGQQQLTPNDSIDRDPVVSSDGRYIVFLSKRAGGVFRLWRMDIDGRNQKLLYDSPEEALAPQITPDGKQVLFTITKVGKHILMQIPVEGGEAKPLTKGSTDLFSISPDGKFLAYTIFDEQKKKNQTIVKAYPDGSEQTFDLSPRDILTWTPDSKNLIFNYTDTKQSSPSVFWQQPVKGGDPKPFITFKQEVVRGMTFSPDGKKIAMVGGRLITDAVMLQRK